MDTNPNNYPTDIRIAKIEQATLKVDRPEIGVNSQAKQMIYPEPGWKWNEPIIRIYTSDGGLGWGVGRLDAATAQRALGQNPFDLLNPKIGVSNDFQGMENALWDIIGRILGKPAYRLIGDQSYADWLPVYDSTIYFNDLLYDTKEAGLRRIAADVEQSLERGYRACKMKIGRGNHMMERSVGLQRDIEVVKLARQTAGEGFDILVDANNAYTYDETVAFLSEVGDLHIFWVEEMFEEEILLDCSLKTYIANKQWKTLVADGETRTRQPLEFFEPFFQAGALDVIQHDMKGLGVTGWRRLADMALRHKVKCAPHNWASLFGLYLSLQFGKTIPHFLYGEVATLSSDVVDASGYVFKNGAFSVPDTPGLGLELNLKVYEAQYAGREDWNAAL
jgi:L-alanine-DL-glutamate epimerase-like enolase superfamily enzyme